MFGVSADVGDYLQVLHPAGASINVNQTIWDVYFNKLLPLFAAEGDDGNYGPAAACDLACLQVYISKGSFNVLS